MRRVALTHPMIPPLCFKRGGALDTRASAALSLTRNATEGCLTCPQFLFCHFERGRGAQHPTNLFHPPPPHDLSCNLCNRGVLRLPPALFKLQAGAWRPCLTHAHS